MITYIKYKVKVYSDGTKQWYLNGKLHREDKPAYEGSSGTKEWWLNGKLHREDGPAIEWLNGTKEWWVNGEKLTEEEHKKAMSSSSTSCVEGKVVEIDGKKYKLVAESDSDKKVNWYDDKT